jgi:hypothetical protein
MTILSVASVFHLTTSQDCNVDVNDNTRLKSRNEDWSVIDDVGLCTKFHENLSFDPEVIWVTGSGAHRAS